MSPVVSAKPPWHLWVIGLFFVLLNGAGAYDYVMTRRHDPVYFASQNYDETQIVYFTDYPIVPAVFWTIAVWGALIASTLLLLRSRWATPVAFVALIAQLCLFVVTFAFMDRFQILGPRLALFDCVILLLTVGLLLYCRAMSRRGILR